LDGDFPLFQYQGRKCNVIRPLWLHDPRLK
jgi:hypothetical protein